MSDSKIAFESHETRVHLISSMAVTQTYRIKVQLPMRLSNGTERFPVLYCTDSDDFFDGLATIANILQLLGEAPRFILVGIGYENPRLSHLLRMRDLFPDDIRTCFQAEIEQTAVSPLIGEVVDTNAVTNTTDAKDFLNFIRGELIPFVDAHYSTIPGDNSYSGYSAGGAFGFYTLFTEPATFGRYILGSPATSHSGRHFGIELAKSFIRSGQTMGTKVFMSVGDLEEFKRGQTQFDLVTGYYLMAKFLMQAAIPGLDLTIRLFPGETHATAWSPAFSHGVRALFGAVDQVPFWPKFLK
jgi:predicted alpha/beta superfamily hydrolase